MGEYSQDEKKEKKEASKKGKIGRTVGRSTKESQQENFVRKQENWGKKGGQEARQVSKWGGNEGMG